MVETKPYENFPLRIPFIAILISIIGYILGAIILSGFGIVIVILYLIYCGGIELLVIFRSCKDCYYYGKICGLGKGRIAPFFIKKGNSKRFGEKKISWYDLIPDFLVPIIPIIGGIILIVVLEIFSKAFKEPVKPANAFLAVLVVSIINNIGIMGLLMPYLGAIPYVLIILPALIWIIMIKAFFGELSIIHAIVVGIIFYAITLIALPMLTGFVMGFIPSFG